MKTINKTFMESVTESITAAANEFGRICRHTLRRIDRMPWPSLLALCLMVALLVSVLPLALTLFVLFLLVKVVAGAFGWSQYQRRRDRTAAAAPHVHDDGK